MSYRTANGRRLSRLRLQARLRAWRARSVRWLLPAAIALFIPCDMARAEAVDLAAISGEMARVRQRVERIRDRLGRPVVAGVLVRFGNPQAEDLYFQAQTLWGKSNRLCFEVARETSRAPAEPKRKVGLEDVLSVLQATRARLDRVCAELDLEPDVTEPNPTLDSGPDVLADLMGTNCQLNRLLEIPYSASDVYQQVTLAMSYADRLRSRYPGSRMPATPPLIEGKEPIDVTRRLIGCIRRLEKLSLQSGVHALSVADENVRASSIRPGDNYELATLIVGELRDLNSHRPGLAAVRGSFYPGEKSQSQLCQRIGILEAQLEELLMLHDSSDAARPQATDEGSRR